VTRRLFPIAIVCLLLMFCSKAPETATATTPAPVTTSSTATAATVPAPSSSTTPVASVPAATTTSAAPASASLQSQETNWSGVTADVTELRRKGNSLTAKVRLTNKGANKVLAEISWKDVALVDAAGGKKYEVLKDEKGTYIASTRAGWNDRWSEWIEPSSSQVVWMKFPAPPPEVKTITLQLPKTPPFDDLPIQD
jgi:hypothetical protein